MSTSHVQQRAKVERLNPSVGDQVVLDRLSPQEHCCDFLFSFLRKIVLQFRQKMDICGPFTMTSDTTGHYKGKFEFTMRVLNRHFVTWTQRKHATTPNNRNHAQSFRESLQINQWKSMTIDENRWKSIICEKILWLSIDHGLANINRYQLTSSIDWYQLINWISSDGFSSILHAGD